MFSALYENHLEIPSFAISGRAGMEEGLKETRRQGDASGPMSKELSRKDIEGGGFQSRTKYVFMPALIQHAVCVPA